MSEMRFFKRCLLSGLLITGLVSPSLFSQPDAQASQVVDIHTPFDSICAKGEGADGKALLLSMQAKVHKMKGYSFDSILTTYKGGKVIIETGKLYFESPDKVRFEVYKAGSRSGAVVIRQADGQICGHMGGALRGIKLKLSPESKLLKTANGFNILDSDLNSLLDSACLRVQAKSKCFTGDCKGFQLVELVDGDGDLTDRIVVAPETKLPEEWNIYVDKQIHSSVHFGNLQVCNDLDDSLFVMKGEKESSKSKSQNIETKESKAQEEPKEP